MRAPETGDQVGPYTLAEKLGVGGFGEVWRADGPEGEVALKLPTQPRFVRYLKREETLLSVIATLDHPNLIREIDADLQGEVPYIAMEYVRGENLRQCIRGADGGFSVHQIVTVSDQVLGALHAVHEAGLVHCDLKPENILIAEDGSAKLIDLGLGRAVAEMMAEVFVSVSMVSAAPVEGTLAYMAPEQKWGGDIGPAADLYAFGVILFEMLTGELPRGIAKPTDLVPELSPRFDILCRRALEPEPSARFESAHAMQEAVGIVVRSRDPQPLPSAPPDERALEVNRFDLSYMELISPYSPGDELEGYTLETLLGRGGFGEVWRAMDEGGAEVAIKIGLGPLCRTRLHHEANMGGRLAHPRIPAVLEERLDVEPPFLVCELMEGVSLRAVLHEQGALPLEIGKRLLGDLAGLLAHCHDMGVVHRDLKPENLLGAENGRAMLLDFGLGELVSEAQQVENSLASVGGRGGTYDYMAPEHLSPDSGPEVDLYALGVLGYEALTGVLPGAAARLRERVPKAPVWLDLALAQMLSRDPSKRGTARRWEVIFLTQKQQSRTRRLQMAARDRWHPTMGVWYGAVCGTICSVPLELLDLIDHPLKFGLCVGLLCTLLSLVLQCSVRAQERDVPDRDDLNLILGVAVIAGFCTGLASVVGKALFVDLKSSRFAVAGTMTLLLSVLLISAVYVAARIFVALVESRAASEWTVD